MNFIGTFLAALKSSSLTHAVLIAASLAELASAQSVADFTLKSATDAKTFSLSQAKGSFVALHFLLKTECPLCLKHTRDYLAKAESVPGVQHIFIKPDTDEEIKQWVANIPTTGSLAVTVYRDPEAGLAKQFNIPDGYKFHGQTVHYPALVLLDGTGKEVFRYVGKSNADRYSFEQFTQKMKELRP